MQGQSKEKLIDCDAEFTTANSTNDNAEVISMQREQNSFMLHKFLSNSAQGIDAINSHPVPRPRQKKLKPSTRSSSKETFDVTSPKILIEKQEEEGNDNSSVRTYEVASPKQVKNNQLENKIGDILIHEAPKTTQDHFIEKGSRTVSVKSGVKSLIHRSESSTSGDTHTYIKNEIDNDKAIRRHSPRVEITNEVKPKPKKRHTKKKQAPTEQEKDIDEVSKADENNHNEKSGFTYEKIMELIIHRTDRLQLNSLVIHPLVKLHIVDINTGKYFPKSDKNRSVVFYYENSDNEYISPVMTQPYNLQENRSVYPKWEESILLNEDINYIIKESANIILFFEIIDFLSFSFVNTHSLKNGWQKIAFAFLKLSGPNGELNLFKKLRLQLYYPNTSIKNCEPSICSIWQWWKKRKMVKYPSTIYITIKEVMSPQKVVETFRSKTPIQSERGSTRLLKNHAAVSQSLKNNIKTESNEDLKSCEKGGVATRKSKYYLNEICKLPNKCAGKIPTCEEGCFIFRFSNSGEYLACSLLLGDVYTAVVYLCDTLEEVQRFPCHRGLIYDIDWSRDDTVLILASADNTVSVWNFKSYKFMQILPHPSFVYTSKIDQEYVIATGCYDKIVRIWVPSENASFVLSQELEQHKGYITTLVFNKKSNLLFSADSLGSIIEWIKEDDNWKFNRNISVIDLKCTVINQILLFPKERRLLVHARDSTLRIVDLKNSCVLHWLQGSLNRRVQTFCSISPCNTYVVSGSENGVINVWDSKSGNQIASYLPYAEEYYCVHCVQFHPKNNNITLSCYGSDLPILVYCYDKSVTKNDIGLRIIDENFAITSRRIETASSKLSLELNALRDVKTFDLKGILNKMDELIITQKPENN